jgi:hypothetical protein
MNKIRMLDISKAGLWLVVQKKQFKKNAYL